MAELKKCPFCGGEAKFTYSVDGNFMHIHCEDANCIGSTIMNDYETEAEAIEAWNNRPTEAEIRGKAVSDFLQFVYENASNEEYANEDGWAMSDLIDLEFKFLKQLKEE